CSCEIVAFLARSVEGATGCARGTKGVRGIMPAVHLPGSTGREEARCTDVPAFERRSEVSGIVGGDQDVGRVEDDGMTRKIRPDCDHRVAGVDESDRADGNIDRMPMAPVIC